MLLKKNRKWLLFSSVLLFYAFLYVATTKRETGLPYACDEICEKFNRVRNHINKDSTVIMASQCSTDQYCITVKDSVARDWGRLVDTACTYIKKEGLQSYKVTIFGYYTQDTLLKQTCP